MRRARRTSEQSQWLSESARALVNLCVKTAVHRSKCCWQLDVYGCTILKVIPCTWYGSCLFIPNAIDILDLILVLGQRDINGIIKYHYLWMCPCTHIICTVHTQSVANENGKRATAIQFHNAQCTMFSVYAKRERQQWKRAWNALAVAVVVLTPLFSKVLLSF